jgi:hypothetical protein
MLSGTDANTGDVVLEPVTIFDTGATGGVYLQQIAYVGTAPASQRVVFCFSTNPASLTAHLGTFDLTTNTATIGHTVSGLADAPDLSVIQDHPTGSLLFTYNDLSGNVAYKQFSTSWVLGMSGTLDTGVSNPYGGHLSSSCVWSDNYAFFCWASGTQVRMSYVDMAAFSVPSSPQIMETFPGPATIFGMCNLPSTGSSLYTFVSAGYGFQGVSGGILIAGQPVTFAGLGFVAGFVGGYLHHYCETTTPVGMVPSACPFLPGNAPTSDVATTVYQPAAMNWMVTSLERSGDTVSEQGTCYLLAFSFNVAGNDTYGCYPAATIAPRQLDMQVLDAVQNVGIPTLGCSPRSFALHCPHMRGYQVDDPMWFTSSIRTTGADIAGQSDAIPGCWAVDWKFDPTSRALGLYQPSELGSELYLSGAVPFVSDGYGCYEVGFFSYPEFTLAVQSGSAGSSTYTWAVVVVYTDSAGNVTRGSPAFTNQITNALISGASYVLIVIPPVCSWRYAQGTGRLEAEIYRTTDVGGTPSSTFQLVDRTPLNENAWTVYNDTATDAQIATASFIYTTGGVLDGVNPPAFSCQCIHWGRLWGVDDTGTNVWFSQQFTPGVAPSFNESLTLSFTDGGKITGLFSLDDKLIIGKESGLWVVYGFGPASNGQGSDLTVPQAIAADGGPLDWRSGIVFEGGLLYRSATGFMLCDRSLNVSWIGKDVVDTLALYPTVMSAVVVPTATQVRFICQNSSGATVTLVYDYLVNKWLTHVYQHGASSVSSATLSSVVGDVNPSFAAICSDGTLWLEHQPSDATAYMDDDSVGNHYFVPTTVTTAWVKIQGVQGYQRARQVQLLFEESDTCGVTMGFAVNYKSETVQSHTWSSYVVDNLRRKVVMQHVASKHMKQLALQVSVSDVQGDTVANGKGARFVGLSLELQPLGGQFRQVPAMGRS